MNKSWKHKRELQIYFQSFLNSTLDESKSSSWRPDLRNPMKEPSTHFMGSLMGPKTDMVLWRSLNFFAAVGIRTPESAKC
jgi:hypothetical protein